MRSLIRAIFVRCQNYGISEYMKPNQALRSVVSDLFLLRPACPGKHDTRPSGQREIYIQCILADIVIQLSFCLTVFTLIEHSVDPDQTP